jgi:hypothetical protein
VKVDFLASWPHFADHLRPIWDALDPDERGSFTVGRDRPPKSSDLTVVASNVDLRRAEKYARRLVRAAHGAGFGYIRLHPSYPGGPGWNRASLILCPNRFAAGRIRPVYPDIPAPIVGTPKMDVLTRLPFDGDGTTIAISFHWDGRFVDEARSAFPHFRSALKDLRNGWRLLGHGHPRAWPMLGPWYKRLRIEAVRDFSEVVRRASVYVADSSSTLYEFAALGRPVVLMNAPWYRRDVHHGLRFWEHTDIGPHANEPEELRSVVETALRDSPAWEAARRRATADIYPHLGTSAERAVAEIRALLREPEEVVSFLGSPFQGATMKATFTSPTGGSQ